MIKNDQGIAGEDWILIRAKNDHIFGTISSMSIPIISAGNQ